MGSVPHIDQPAPPRWVWVAALPFLAVAVGLGLRMYSSFGSDQCTEGYAAAKTAADTARVDSLVPEDEHGVKEKVSCGFRRTSVRWTSTEADSR
jgi:hypothetical protein